MKYLHISIENCHQCPYCEYDSHGWKSKEDRWICKKNKTNDTRGFAVLHEGTEFQWPIPSWCSLSSYEYKDKESEFFAGSY
jgi:hypothetical protein